MGVEPERGISGEETSWTLDGKFVVGGEFDAFRSVLILGFVSGVGSLEGRKEGKWEEQHPDSEGGTRLVFPRFYRSFTHTPPLFFFSHLLRILRRPPPNLGSLRPPRRGPRTPRRRSETLLRQRYPSHRYPPRTCWTYQSRRDESEERDACYGVGGVGESGLLIWVWKEEEDTRNGDEN